MRNVILVLGFALLTYPAFAEEPEVFHLEVPEGAEAPEASADCAAGVVYDDGGFVDFYGVSPSTYAVMRFDLPSGTNALDQVCTCFTKLSSGQFFFGRGAGRQAHRRDGLPAAAEGC